MDNLQSSKPRITNKLTKSLLKKVVKDFQSTHGDMQSKVSVHKLFFSGEAGLKKWGVEFSYIQHGATYSVLRECADELVHQGLLTFENPNSGIYYLTDKGLNYFEPASKINRLATKYQPMQPWLVTAIAALALIVSVSSLIVSLSK